MYFYYRKQTLNPPVYLGVNVKHEIKDVITHRLFPNSDMLEVVQ